MHRLSIKTVRVSSLKSSWLRVSSNVASRKITDSIPLFKRTSLTDNLQSTFEYQLSTKIVDIETMKEKKNFKTAKNTTIGTHLKNSESFEVKGF